MLGSAIYTSAAAHVGKERAMSENIGLPPPDTLGGAPLALAVSGRRAKR
jgi:hypothetical protein